MIFTETALPGAHIIDLQPRTDERGFFARAFCQKEFEQHGLRSVIAQSNIVFSVKKGTVRGMHFQMLPAPELKVVRCTRGALLDVIIDLRPESPTYLHHISVELTEENYRALYVPERFAHGFQTLTDHTEAIYAASEFYMPSTEGGLRFDDPRLGLSWPLPIAAISDKDRTWPSLDELEPGLRRRMSLEQIGEESL